MSVPYTTITCTNCDLAGTSLSLVGLFAWRDQEGRQHSLGRKLGLCHGCESIVPMEVLPTPQDVVEAQSKRAAEPKVRRPGSIRRAWDRIQRVIWPPVVPPTRRLPEESPEVLTAVLALGRRPVCLLCGSSDVEAIPIPQGLGPKDEALHRLGVVHPGCGGELLIHGSGTARAAPFQYVRTYDLFGNLQEEMSYHEWKSQGP